MHTFDHELNFVYRLGVVPTADEVRSSELLVGYTFRKFVLVIECDVERPDAVVFQPPVLVIVVIISRLDQDAIEWKRTSHLERYALANPIALDSFGPGRLNL